MAHLDLSPAFETLEKDFFLFVVLEILFNGFMLWLLSKTTFEGRPLPIESVPCATFKANYGLC